MFPLWQYIAAPSAQLDEGNLEEKKMKTTAFDFFNANGEGKNLFSVAEGVPVENALNWASCFLESAIDSMRLASDAHDDERNVYPALYLVEMAKAVINAVRVTKDIQP